MTHPLKPPSRNLDTRDRLPTLRRMLRSLREPGGPRLTTPRSRAEAWRLAVLAQGHNRRLDAWKGRRTLQSSWEALDYRRALDTLYALWDPARRSRLTLEHRVYTEFPCALCEGVPGNTCPECGGSGYEAAKVRFVPLPMTLAWEIAWLGGRRMAREGPWDTETWGAVRGEFRRLVPYVRPDPRPVTREAALTAIREAMEKENHATKMV